VALGPGDPGLAAGDPGLAAVAPAVVAAPAAAAALAAEAASHIEVLAVTAAMAAAMVRFKFSPGWSRFAAI